MTQHILHVCTQDSPVGQLTFDPLENRYGFRYYPSWMASRDRFYLSPAIALDREPDNPGSVQRFLGNLLPEGRVLDIISATEQISKSNIFGLIRALGKEPVGAFSFMALDADEEQLTREIRAQQQEAVRRPVCDDELSDRIRKRDLMPFPIWDGKVRLSLAGYQDKLQVLVEGDSLSLVDGSLNSSHLLKPESLNPNTPHLVANEHFCMTLARLMTLPVAPVSIRRIPDPILLIERFDRKIVWNEDRPNTAKAVLRQHVIDGCQAVDLPVDYKYERNFGSNRDVRNIREGVSFARLFALLDKTTADSKMVVSAGAEARQFMLRWAVLNLLLGNSDAHGKNLSFFVRPSGLAPAPLYDLVSVCTYDEKSISHELAMAYGDDFRIEDIMPFSLADFAYRTNTPALQLVREIRRLASSAMRLAPQLAKSDVYVGEECDLVQRISEFIVNQAKRLMAIAQEIPKVNTALLRE
ncbi:HipA domain-containing protein [Bordetella tumulicola]|uniref:HipA domain-containing protein n=1 Tax=Bordetella tumulicola TaxID=1649133 RepID=UPI0039EEFE42